MIRFVRHVLADGTDKLRNFGLMNDVNAVFFGTPCINGGKKERRKLLTELRAPLLCPLSCSVEVTVDKTNSIPVG